MFLITKTQKNCIDSIRKMISALEGIECGPVQLIDLGGYILAWSRCKQHENLHILSDACYIGKLTFSENPSEIPISHEGRINKKEIPPLTTGTIIHQRDNQIVVEPLHITNVYYSKDSVSDMQLLIADAEGFFPSHEGVATLSAIGYFPGNITLFNEIKKIPFRSSYNISTRIVAPPKTIEYKKNDDEKMIERLMEIVPNHPKQYLGITGGKDGRFVLGIFLSVGKKPILVHKETGEKDLVNQLAHDVNCEIINVPQSTTLLSPEVYTLATDSQIYYSGGNLGGIASKIERDSLFHSGIYAGLLIKDTFKTAFKMPGPLSKIYHRCLTLLLSSIKPVHDALSKFNTYDELYQYLRDELHFGNHYVSFKQKKEWTNWFYYINRSIRWGDAVTMDLSYFTQPVFLLSDLEAVCYGISSPQWKNYAYERAMRLNKLLMPFVNTPYAKKIELSENSFLRAFQKLKFEYFSRLLASRSHKKQYQIKSKQEYNSQSLANVEPKLFKRYYTKSLEEISQHHVPYSLKRASVTLVHTLDYLEN